MFQSGSYRAKKIQLLLCNFTYRSIPARRVIPTLILFAVSKIWIADDRSQMNLAAISKINIRITNRVQRQGCYCCCCADVLTVTCVWACVWACVYTPAYINLFCTSSYSVINFFETHTRFENFYVKSRIPVIFSWYTIKVCVRKLPIRCWNRMSNHISEIYLVYCGLEYYGMTGLMICHMVLWWIWLSCWGLVASPDHLDKSEKLAC